MSGRKKLVFSAEHLAYMDKFYAEKVSKDEMAGIVTLVARTAKLFISAQSAMPTLMNNPISKYLPEFANLQVLRNPDASIEDTVPLERVPTIQDVLRHTAGFSHGLHYGCFRCSIYESKCLRPRCLSRGDDEQASRRSLK